MLQEANRFKRQDLLQHANADQFNAVSELVLNLLKNNIPVTPPIMAQLRPYKKVLRDLGRRQHSVILGVPGAASRDDGIFMGESLQQERESPWACGHVIVCDFLDFVYLLFTYFFLKLSSKMFPLNGPRYYGVR